MIESLFLDNPRTPAELDQHVFGVVVGIVTNNQDPDKLGRVKVKFPWLNQDDESHWARIATPMAGASRGVYFLPEVDDEVLVAFEHGRMEAPYIVGALWSGKSAPPESNSDSKNNKRSITSRSGHVVRFDDTSGGTKIEILGEGNKESIVIDTTNHTIQIQSDADVTITSANGKLTLSAKGIEVKSQAGIKVEAQADVDLKASGQMNIKGTTINLN